MDRDDYQGSGERARTHTTDGVTTGSATTSSVTTGGNTVTAQSAAEEVAQDARRRGEEVVGKAAHEAQRLAGRFREQAGGALGEGKTQLASQIGGVARALKASSEQLRKDDLGSLADLSDGLAGQVEAVQHYLGERSGEALLGDLRIFARRRGLFVGSLLAAGLLAARFAQSSADRTQTGRGGATRSGARGSATVVSQGRVRTYPGNRS